MSMNKIRKIFHSYWGRIRKLNCRGQTNRPEFILFLSLDFTASVQSVYSRLVQCKDDFSIVLDQRKDRLPRTFSPGIASMCRDGPCAATSNFQR